MKTLNVKKWSCLPLMLLAATFTSCLDDGDETIVLEEGKYSVLGIPSDKLATPNPEINNPNANIPNFNYIVEEENGQTIIRLDMTGVQDPNTKEWLSLIGTGGNGTGEQNIWVSVDGKPKGILVTKASDDENSTSNAVDLVFLVDNSGSMSEEADAIARDIVAWAKTLAASNLDVRFGCVGYDGNITGALNITDVNSLSEFLNYSSGTRRTAHFGGPDASVLHSAKTRYDVSSNVDECGVAALRFAANLFSFRRGANRIYVNFTDEPNFPQGKNDWSVEFVNNQSNWNTADGTIHTVYSDTYTNFNESPLYKEKPWKLSDYTGGTTIIAPSNFSGVTLSDLPVTGAMLNSYIIRFTNVDEFMDGQPHEVHITVYSKDGKVQADKVFYVVFGTK